MNVAKTTKNPRVMEKGCLIRIETLIRAIILYSKCEDWINEITCDETNIGRIRMYLKYQSTINI